MGVKKIFICSECNNSFPRWAGQCPNCQEWNTFIEEIVDLGNCNSAKKTMARKQDLISFVHNEVEKLSNISIDDDIHRLKTNIGEIDRVLGGGFVKGSFTLLAGEPGAGKSTLVLQICEQLKNLENILYVTGEESTKQIKLRAKRLGVNGNNTSVITETNIQKVIELIKKTKPSFIIIDSIQTMYSDMISSNAGSIAQVKECASLLLSIIKSIEIPTIIIGHVNKDGAIAGPKVLEHIVDTVLYFEVDKTLPFKILRAEKNRYGSTNEIGMFDMTMQGLIEIKNPSETLLKGRAINVSGSCISCIMDGIRPVLAEIQALTVTTNFGMPRRTTNGIDFNRLNLLTAIIEKRLGHNLSTNDIYLNVVGGLKLNDPACDLSIIISIISSLLNKPCDASLIAIGEVGLGGEIRACNFIDTRISEASKLGFKKILIPEVNVEQIKHLSLNIEVVPVKHIKDIIKIIFAKENK